MSNNKKLKNLLEYKGVLPYSSELFGVYQPLLGWKSRRKDLRMQLAFQPQVLKSYENIIHKDFHIISEPSNVSIEVWEKFNAKQFSIKLKPNKNNSSSIKFNSQILSKLNSDFTKHIDHSSFDKSFSEACTKFLNYDYINELLNDKNDDSIAQRNIQSTKNYFETLNNKQIASIEKYTYEIFRKSMEAEAKIGGLVVNLASNKQFDELKTILGFSSKFSNNIERSHKDYLDFIFQKDISSKGKAEVIALSPIGLVHMFRQYFFELDTFLGTPISHVWLSPGASAELIETTTRKHLVEKNTEFSTESTIKQESSSTNQEELSEAVKQNNKEDIKLGASVTASYSCITASANFNYDKSQEEAKENTHKRTRQQTEKISQELKQSYKTTFKTVTETTDTSSKRYVLSNTTDQLINYEMRRKMRQVAVQVQDIGTYLCWETFVDEPGKTLGLSNLVHIADGNEKSDVPDPELIVLSPLNECVLTIGGMLNISQMAHIQFINIKSLLQNLTIN